MKSIVGIDIGSTNVRAAEVVGVDANGFAVVRKLAISPVSDGAVQSGRVKNPEEVAMSLIRVIKEGGFSKYGPVIGISSPDVALTRISLPASVRKSERASAIKASGRSIAPTYGLEESVLSTSLIAVTAGDETMPTSTIDVASVRNIELEALLAACKIAKITPRAIDLTGAALLRSLTRANPQFGEVSTVVDIGATKTTIVTREGLSMRSLRTINGGGQDLTRAIMTVVDDDYRAAEERKHGLKLNNATMETLSTTYLDVDLSARKSPLDVALSNAADLLVDAIGQAVETDAANYGNFTQGIALCGGSSLMRGIKDRIQARVGVPVMIGRPWAEIEQTRRNSIYFKDGRPDPKVLLSIAPAVGLGLWREPA
ncbi:MAG: pilus assembly protein PilM [Candidatus Paceibacterota bacterium]